MKPTSDFYFDSNRQTGFTAYCRECNKAATRESYGRRREFCVKQKSAYRLQNPERVIASRKRHAENRTKEQRTAYLSYLHLYRSNPETRAKYLNSVKRWNEANPDRVKAQRKGIDHRRRARKMSSGSFSASEWMSLCEHYGNRCLKCRCVDPLTPDHVVPLKLGGPNTIDNIQPLCLACNVKKGIKVVDYRKEYRYGSHQHSS